MPEVPMTVTIRKIPNKPDLFEFTFSTPALRSQFRLPRVLMNKLRILIEQALTSK
ncbi:MAG: hypothetical protein JW867_04510 [Candidatus Omnitrophica bacterium]|nr:hypothetical protein [Candidatus Omnitrophota bacterium]